MGRKLHEDAGIAIGPILFTIALVAVLAAAFSKGNGIAGETATIDRVSSQIVSQVNLIRQKVIECQMISMGKSIAWAAGSVPGWPAGASPGVAVSSVVCPGDPAGLDNLWTGARSTFLPKPPDGFGAWQYVNSNTSTGHPCGNAPVTGGVCIYTIPTMGASVDPITKQAVTKAMTRFDVPTEAYWDPNNGDRRISFWIKR